MSCGEGIQVRVVQCKDEHDQPSVLCHPHSKPATSQSCSTGIQCPFSMDRTKELLPGVYDTQALFQPYLHAQLPRAEGLVGEHVIPSEST